jgi:lysophospholipase L1-like esterase
MPTNQSSILQAYTAWGDSLTQGGQGYVTNGEYPADLQQMLGPVSLVMNEGLSGETSPEIGVREGGIQTTVTVSGGTIPASGPVAVTFPANYAPVIGPGSSVTGTIAGVHGTVAYSATDAAAGPLFIRLADGDAVPVPGAVPFVVDPTYVSSGFVPIFWEGENDSRNTAASIQATVSNVSAQVTWAHSASYLVMGVINTHLGGQAKGQSGYQGFITLNDLFAQTFPNNFVDIRSVLVSNYDPTNAIDVTDYNDDLPPTSLAAIQGAATLASDIDASTTTVVVNVTAGVLVNNDMLNIGTGADAESMRITSVSGNTVTVTRGAGGSQEAHPAGSAVTCTDTVHLNGKGYSIVANTVHQWFGQHP